jgi:hypothetical protein
VTLSTEGRPFAMNSALRVSKERASARRSKTPIITIACARARGTSGGRQDAFFCLPGKFCRLHGG